MYHDYFDHTETSGLRNPYGPEVPLLPEDRGSHRQRLLLLGIVGAGLSVVGPAAGLASPGPSGAGQVTAAGTQADPRPPAADHP